MVPKRRRLNWVTGLSHSPDKQPQAWLNWGKEIEHRGGGRQGGGVAQSGDDSLKDTSDSNWGRDWVQVSVTGTGRGGRRVQQAVMVSGTWAQAGTGVSFSSGFPRRPGVCGPVILFYFICCCVVRFFKHSFQASFHSHYSHPLTVMFDARGALQFYEILVRDALGEGFFMKRVINVHSHACEG